jgi:L-ascorbate 6-phosphate lactonase
MESFAKRVSETQVEPGSVAIFWLAQAGFVFKTPDGTIIYSDPYLTNYVERVLPEYGFGFKRIMASLIESEEVDADYVTSTHLHQDHFDADAVPILMKNPRIHFMGAPDCQELYQQAGVPENRYTIFHQGETLKFGDFSLTGVYADHGDAAPDALGILFNFNGIKVWQVGDTAYRPDMWQEIFKEQVDVLLPPINGAFGNLNGVEAAKLAQDSGCKLVIPCHFWMFAMHYGNPQEFLEACKTHAPHAKPYLMTQGERIIYRK